MRKLIAKLVFPTYVLGIIFVGYTAAGMYLNANAILDDHTVIDAPMEFVGTSSRTKRGHTSVTYKFTYSYTVDGREYVAPYSAVNEHGESYRQNPVLTIAYSNADPSKADKLSVLEHQASLWNMIKGFLMMWLFISIAALFVFGWAAAGIPDEDEVEELDELDGADGHAQGTQPAS